MSRGIGCRQGLDPELLWLWRRPAATAPIRPLDWESPYESPYAAGAAQEMAKRQNKTKQKFFAIMVYHRTLNMVLRIIQLLSAPCAVAYMC